MNPYAQALKAFDEAGIRYAVIGTYALKALFPVQLSSYRLKDCDLVLQPSLKNIQAAVHILISMQWQLSIWEAPLPDPLTEADLQGKFYIRARRGTRVTDLTYECAIPWPEMEPETMLVSAFTCASIQHILQLKRLKGLPADLAMAESVDAWISKD